MEPRARSKGSLLVKQGQVIRYWLYGDKGVPMILCNSLLGGVGAWMPFVRHFASSHRLLLWEYQGHGLSAGSGRAEVSVRSFAEDSLRLLAGAGIERAIFVGLGLGVQVVFEAVRTSPQSVLSLVGISGAEDGQLSGIAPPPLAHLLSRWLNRMMLPLGVPVWRFVHAAWAAYLPLHRKSRRHPDQEEQAAGGREDSRWVEKISRTDPQVGLRILASMLFYRPDRLLPLVGIPVLILGGTEDRLVSPDRYAEMARRIPGSRLVLLPGCSHSLMDQEPAQVNRTVEEFLLEQGVVRPLPIGG